MDDLIYRWEAIDAMTAENLSWNMDSVHDDDLKRAARAAQRALARLPAAQSKYEYHYDHTDCIWYRPEARNRCPTTCAQYRDGWNDAMNYIFRDGKGYRPYRRDKEYGE